MAQKNPYNSTDMMGGFNDSWDQPSGAVGYPPVDPGQLPQGTGTVPPGMPPAAPPSAPSMGREQWRDAFMAAGGGMKSMGDMESWLAQNGGAIEDARSGKIRTPHGELIDGAFDADNAGGQFRAGMWTRTFDPSNPQAFQGGGGGSGGPGGGFGAASSGRSGLFDPDVMNQLKSMFPDGMFNKEVVSRRTENAREDMNRFSKSRNATNRALLADRGLLGSGPEATALLNAEGDIADRYSNAVSGIYADESENADSRMMQALQLAGGMTSEEARLLMDSALGNRRIDVDRELGLGNLSLGNRRADIDYTLGRGNYDLGRADLDFRQRQSDTGSLIDLLEQLYRGAGQSAEGAY